MIEFLKNWVFNLVTLVVFIVLLEILIPSGKFKKFINLASGFVLIIAIINPVLGLFSKNIDLKDFIIPSSNFIDKYAITENGKHMKDDQMKQIVNVYREKIIKQMEESVKETKGIQNVRVDLIINEDYKAEKFGEIKRVFLYLDTAESNSKVKPVAKVETIEINTKQPGKNPNTIKESENLDRGIKNQIENKISQMFNIQKEQIVISLQNEGG